MRPIPVSGAINLTDYHAKYFACGLTKRCPSDSLEKLAGAIVDARVDLNPHQVEAALFAFRSPLSKGALLADEVGLGKTIEAGLVLSQKWAERKRRLLVVVPSSLRKQWHQELTEKFFLPCAILESRSYNQAIKQGLACPFDTNSIIICSYQYAHARAADIGGICWDLVVFDEAHRLRNVYKPNNKIANSLRETLRPANKLLLTATPLQNSLLELYGLVSFIDEHAFGDLKSFREQFANLNDADVLASLKSRLKPICHRTLRRQVTTYVNYTRRLPIVQEFTPEQAEDRLYELVSDYLRRDNLLALPASQRALMTLVLRKLLASSTFAIAGALDTIVRRLRARLEQKPTSKPLETELSDNYEALDELVDEWATDEEEEAPDRAYLSNDDRCALAREIDDLEGFRSLAVSISQNAKGLALLTALKAAFEKADQLGAPRKAIIFTESRRTQDYLFRVLRESPYREGISLFNGTNNDHDSRMIYSEWVKRHIGSDRITGSQTADMRSALVDYFREQGQIMIATEAGAEGINLQFCSLVVNYDLPWNPQRIEQRIGRCHRYGQKHDVVVVNFLNQKNEADQRVFQLLSEKFSLFDGVFGASDEVLGAIESGVDFEKRIVAIYQQCRTSAEITTSFDHLQTELSAEITDTMARTRQKLLENFDAEVHEKLRICFEQSQANLNRYERLLMQLTRHELGDLAEFSDEVSAFVLKRNPFPEAGDQIPIGRYELPRRTGDAHLYRLGHPLAERILARVNARLLPPAEIVFNYTRQPTKIAALQPYVGNGGKLLLSRFSAEALDHAEDHFICTAVTDLGELVDEVVATRLFMLPALRVNTLSDIGDITTLRAHTERRKAHILQEISERTASYFEAEVAKLDGWADDLKVALEREIKELDRQLKEVRRAAAERLTLEGKLASQRQIKALELQRNSKRRSLFEAQDEIDQRRERLITETEHKLQNKTSLEDLLEIRWSLI